jgi:hypothetical protein
VKWWNALSTRTQGIIGIVGILALAALFGGRNTSNPSAANATPTATRTTIAATAVPSSTLSPVIVGMTTADIEGNLKARGFSCGAPKAGQAGATAVQSVECLSTDGNYLYSVTHVSESATRVRLVTASITPATTAARSIIDQSAGVFLGFIATLPYTGAKPTDAQNWVKENAAKPGATMTIGSAFFEIDPTPSDSGSRRLNVVAVGAR